MSPSAASPNAGRSTSRRGNARERSVPARLEEQSGCRRWRWWSTTRRRPRCGRSTTRSWRSRASISSPTSGRRWRSYPPLLEEVWRGLSRAMAPGRLDALTKEMIALAVSATNGCTYCIRSHTAAARKLGMDDAMLGELMAVVGTFNRTNKLADGYQVPVDPQLLAATEGAAPAGPGSAAREPLAAEPRSPSRKAQRTPQGRATRTPAGAGRDAAGAARRMTGPPPCGLCSPPPAHAARAGGDNALRGIAADVRLDLLLRRDARLDPPRRGGAASVRDRVLPQRVRARRGRCPGSCATGSSRCARRASACTSCAPPSTSWRCCRSSTRSASRRSPRSRRSASPRRSSRPSLAALILGEVVRLRRWSAIAVGFVGVLIIVRPGFADDRPRPAADAVLVARLGLRADDHQDARALGVRASRSSPT